MKASKDIAVAVGGFIRYVARLDGKASDELAGRMPWDARWKYAFPITIMSRNHPLIPPDGRDVDADVDVVVVVANWRAL